jgi:hypothetical protein
LKDTHIGSRESGYQIPITIDDYHPFTWHGLFDPQYVFDSFAGTLHHEALRALRRAWYIIVIDPVWGRRRYLWQQIEEVMRQGAAPFDIRPSPNLALDVDFVY